MRPAVFILALGLTLAACGGDKSDGGAADAAPGVDGTVGGSDAALQCVGDVRSTSNIYYGTQLPTYVPLTSGQILSIGALSGCSATLITPSWVLTARHCGVNAGDNFCVGVNPSNPNTCWRVLNVIDHPEQDTTLAYLGADARDKMPSIEPIPIMDEALDQSWVGRTAEAAGYGDQEDNTSGEREFTAEPIVTVGEWLTIDGEGTRGACFGDSGGPVMVIASDGSVRVAGDLSWGSTNCLGEDNYARTDVIADWIESYVGPTVVGDGPHECGAIGSQGRCMAAGNVAMWCGGDSTLQTETCSSGSACGWDGSASGYRCITEADPCGGFDTFGACDGAVARWCENGASKSRDCGSCAQLCALDASAGGASCVADPCAGLDFLGRCNGNVAEWCDNGRFQSRDCAESGEVCEYINDQIGYFCR